MFSSVKHERNLLQSERFKYEEFQFYNEYESMEKYKNDVNKVMVNIGRKPKLSIYAGSNNLYNKIQHEVKLNRDVAVNTFSFVYFENNVSSHQGYMEEDQQVVMLQYFPEIIQLRESHSSFRSRSNQNKYTSILDIVSSILQYLKNKIHKIQEMANDDSIPLSEIDYYSSLLCYLKFSCHQLLHLNEYKADEELLTMNRFLSLVSDLLEEINDSTAWGHLILCMPKVSIIGYFLNPIVIGSICWIKQKDDASLNDVEQDKFTPTIPKIAIVNLDGFDTPTNINFLTQNKTSKLFYISFLLEEHFNTQHEQINQMYSQLMIRTMDEINQQLKTKSKDKKTIFSQPTILLFPLNSSHVQSTAPNRTSSIQPTSDNIYYIFEKVVFPELRVMMPHIIVVSYSGKLPISTVHFENITKMFNLITDHRVVLFYNGYECPPLEIQFPTEMEQQINEEQMESFPIIKDYMEKIHHPPEVHEELFDLFAIFGKITGGSYNLNLANVWNSQHKYSLQNVRDYLNTLYSLKQFGYLKKYQTSSNSSVQALFRRQQIPQNLQHSPYEHYFTKAINNLICLPQLLPTNKQMRVKQLQQQLKHKKQTLMNYLLQRKQHLYTTPQQTNIVHHVNQYTLEVKKYKLVLRGNRTQNIILWPFTQVFFCDRWVYCVNYFRDGKLMWLWGKVTGNDTVEMEVMEDQEDQENCFVQYSCFKTQQYVYLYWPRRFLPVDEAECLLLGIEHHKVAVHKMVRIKGRQMEEIGYWETESILPKIGSSGYEFEGAVYIFGGIYDNQHDYGQIDSGVCQFVIDQHRFTCKAIGKKPNNVLIRPKMYYQVEPTGKGSLLVKGGYGREFTNFYLVFSCFVYEFYPSTTTIILHKVPRYVNNIPHPLYLPTHKKYIHNINNKPVTFSTPRPLQSPLHPLFPTVTHIKRIYFNLHCSPEFFILNKQNQLQRIQLHFECDRKKQHYILKDKIFPYEDSLLACCGNGKHVYMLGRSQLYTRNHYHLFKGVIDEEMKVDLSMRKVLEFKENTHQLQNKGHLHMYGGKSKHQTRYDYVLCPQNSRTEIKTYKLTCKQDLLDMPRPFILNLQDHAFLYSCVGERLKIEHVHEKGRGVKIGPIITGLLHNQQPYSCQLQMKQPMISMMEPYQYSYYQVLLKHVNVVILMGRRLELNNDMKGWQNIQPFLMQILSLTKQQILNKAATIMQHFSTIVEELEQHEASDEIQHIVKMLYECVRYVRVLEVEEMSMLVGGIKEKPLYRIMLEDRKNWFMKYVGVGNVGSHQLVFMRLRYIRPVFTKLFTYLSEDLDIYGFHPVAGPAQPITNHAPNKTPFTPQIVNAALSQVYSHPIKCQCFCQIEDSQI